MTTKTGSYSRGRCCRSERQHPPGHYRISRTDPERLPGNHQGNPGEAVPAGISGFDGGGLL